MAATKYTSRFRTVYDALALIIKTLYLLGYTGFYKIDSQYIATKHMLVYNIVMPVFIIGGVTLGTYLRLTNPANSQSIREMDTLLLSAMMLEICIAVVSFVVNIISMQVKRNQHIRVVEHLHQLDTQLVSVFDARMCYEKFAWKTNMILTVFFVYAGLVTLMLVIHLGLSDAATVIGIVCCYFFILAGMQLSTYGYMTMADLIRIRFRLLQKLLAPEYLRKHFAEGDVRVAKLRQAIEIYRGLYEVIDELNSVYGLCLLSSMAHDFTLATIQLYLMFGRSSNLESVSNLMLFISAFATLLPPGYKMVMMPIYSTMSMEEGKKCMRAIKLMDDAFPGDGRVRQIVGATLQWSNHNKAEYKIGHTITSNKGMMASVITALVNYVVIMIQFQIQEEIFTKEMDKRGIV